MEVSEAVSSVTTDPTIQQLGLGGLVAILVLREVFGFLRDKKHSTQDSRIDDLDEDVDEIKLTMAKLSTTMDNQTRILERMVDRQDRLADDLRSALTERVKA